MSFITSYGIALPHYRVEDNTLHPANKKGPMKAVCFSDEDIITLAYEASINCIESSHFPSTSNGDLISQIDGILFATSTPVFKGRYHASYLADLLKLPQGILALDFNNSVRSGTDALLLAHTLIDSCKYKNILLIASDIDFPGIGNESTTPFGHAACSLLLSSENGFAEITDAKSFSSAFAEEFSYKNNRIQYDPRFSRDAGFVTNLQASLKQFISNPKPIDAIILNSVYARMSGGIFMKAGFDEKQFSKDSIASKIGNTGSAHALLLLIHGLEAGKKNILLADYTNGTNFFEIKNNSNLVRKPLMEQLNNYELVKTYQDYLSLRKTGNFNSIKYKTKEMFSSEMMQEREKDTLLYLQGLKCEECGTIYYLKQAQCKKCKCKNFSEVQLKKTGTVYTLTAEHYFPASFPPINMAVIDLDFGGRITVQQTDTMYPENNKIEIGSRVKLVLRKMIENDAKPNYFWKAKLL